ncbi:MAG: hypothetical protein ABJA90_06765 [Ginsengibacter sp.]
MKQLSISSIFLLCMMILFQSCSKPSVNELIAPASSNVINAKIIANQTYTLNISSMPNVNVEKQASHYKISKTGTDEKSGQPVYQYQPAQDFKGSDEIVLSSKVTVYSTDNRSGCSSSHVNDNAVSVSYSTSYTTIRFTVSN